MSTHIRATPPLPTTLHSIPIKSIKHRLRPHQRQIQLQQPNSIIPPHIDLIIRIHSQCIPPLGALLDILVRVINREHDPVCADLGDRVLQSRGREMAARRDPDVFAEVVADGVFCFVVCVAEFADHPVVWGRQYVCERRCSARGNGRKGNTVEREHCGKGRNTVEWVWGVEVPKRQR